MRRPPALIAMLACLLGLQPITTDLYLPALPRLAGELEASMGSTQATLSALLFAFGLSQLVLGPMADRFGRRPVLLVALSLYVAASLGSTLASSIGVLVLWRAVQGIGLGAAVVCARAVVRDLYLPADGARVMSKALTGLGIIALSSPVLGAGIVSTLGWRATLLATATFGGATLALVACALPETAPRRNPDALRPGPMLATWWRILRHPTFLAWALLTASTYAGVFAFLAGSSFVFIEVLGREPWQCGVFVASASLSYLVGTVWCRRLLPRHGLAGSARRGAILTLIGGLSMATLALSGVSSPWAIIVPQWFYSCGHGVHQACGQAAVLGPFPKQAGAASALAGFILAAGAVTTGAWLGVAMDGSVLPMTLTIGVLSVLTALVAWTLVQRHGR